MTPEYIKELEDAIQRLTVERDDARNDTRLSDGAYAMCNTNLKNALADNATLRSRIAALERDGERLLSEVALDLCHEIEGYPPSEQQTTLSIAAAALRKAAQVYEETRPLTAHETSLIDNAWERHKVALGGTGSEHGQLAASGGRNAPTTPPTPHPAEPHPDKGRLDFLIANNLGVLVVREKWDGELTFWWRITKGGNKCVDHPFPTLRQAIDEAMKKIK